MTIAEFLAAIQAADTKEALRAAVDEFEPTFRLMSNKERKPIREKWKRRQADLGTKV